MKLRPLEKKLRKKNETYSLFILFSIAYCYKINQIELRTPI